LGAFDTSGIVFDAIGNDELAFTVGQQQALQGALGILLAALHAMTGMSLASSANSEYDEYLLGPLLITKATLPWIQNKFVRQLPFPYLQTPRYAHGR
jgi:ABC-type sugar transport system substrate-binding protein